MKPAIAIKDINFSYPQTKNILSIAEMTVFAGEKVFIYGPSGSGKTTLLNLIAGILVSQSGSLTILDKNIMALSESKRDSSEGRPYWFCLSKL